MSLAVAKGRMVRTPLPTIEQVAAKGQHRRQITEQPCLAGNTAQNMSVVVTYLSL